MRKLILAFLLTTIMSTDLLATWYARFRAETFTVWSPGPTVNGIVSRYIPSSRNVALPSAKLVLH
ncbi:MAG: hypothetical protein ACXAEN_00955 [Candidatus Thorarchaeota archaeon]